MISCLIGKTVILILLFWLMFSLQFLMGILVEEIFFFFLIEQLGLPASLFERELLNSNETVFVSHY